MKIYKKISKWTIGNIALTISGICILITGIYYIYNDTQSLKQAKLIPETEIFMYTRNTKTNVRNGPGKEYNILNTIHTQYIPVKVISVYNSWYNIVSIDNKFKGWVLNSLLSPNYNYGIIVKRAPLFKNRNLVLQGYIDANTNVKIKKCYDYNKNIHHTICKIYINIKNKNKVVGYIYKDLIIGYTKKYNK